MLAFVLGSGAARGLAHIGVLKHLEEIDIKPDLVVGCSMGAMIGSLYASGMSASEIEKMALKTDYRKLFSLIDITAKKGLIKGDKLMRYISRHLKRRKIEKFPIKFACVAADIIHGKEIVFTKGDATRAVRASISIPGIFRPVKFRKTYLVDGGITNPVPVSVAKNLGANKIIAVDVNSKMKLFKKNLGFLSTLTNAIDIMEIKLSDIKEEKNLVVLRPNISDIGRFDYLKAKKIISIGYRESKKREKDIILLSKKRR